MNPANVGASLLSGALLALLFPPYGHSVLAWAALAPLLWSLRGVSSREGFFLGLLSGFLGYGLILWWVQPVMVTYGRFSPWLAWAITALLAAYMALYVGLFGWLLARLARRSPGHACLMAAPIWVALELTRAYALTGFPWALLGYSQYRVLPIIQVADITGVYGISFLVVMANSSIWHLLWQRDRLSLIHVGGAAALLLLALNYGSFRLAKTGPRSPAVEVGIVQGNTAQAQKWNPGYREAIVRAHERLTEKIAAPRKTRPSLIVWPEAALPAVYDGSPEWRDRMERLARRNGSYLLFGALGLGAGEAQRKLTNSAFLIGPDGERLGRYDKMHLVPFGEYVPFGRILSFVQKLVPVIGQIEEGGKTTLFDMAGAKFGVLICFEAIFPRVARRFREAGFLVNITNDSWFGRTAASEQHLSMVALRAVELRLPVVRAASTGISAFIDPTGAIRQRSPLFEQWAGVGSIQPRKNPTFYALYGDLFAYACVFLVFGAGIHAVTPRKTLEQDFRESP